MARRTKKVASRGSVNNIILESLLTGDKYGYEIIKEVETKTNGKVKLKQPSLYSSLKRFEDKKYITSYWSDSDIGGKRHYYKLTEAGRKYFLNKKSNKYFDDDDSTDEIANNENIRESSPTFELDTHEEPSYIDNKLYTFSVEDKLNSLLNDNQPLSEAEDLIEQENILTSDEESIDEDDLNQIYDAMDEEERIVNPIEELSQQEQDEIVPDHIFYTPTPLNSEIEKPTIKNSVPIMQQTYTIEEEKPEIIVDEFGITKLKSDIVKHTPNKIIDNVNGRIDFKDHVAESTARSNQKLNAIEKLTDEQRTKNTENFIKKFEEISKEKYSQNTSDDLNYRNILGELYADDDVEDQPIKESTTYAETENIEFEPVKSTPMQEKVNSNPITLDKYSKEVEEEGFNVKLYNKTNVQSFKNQYLLINKLKLTFGIFMSLLMVLQTTTILMILKSQQLFYTDQIWVFVGGYILAGIIALVYIIPYFIAPRAQQTRSIKFNYTMLFGLLAFFVSLILIYAVNTFLGLDFTNTSHFLSTILVPTILATNFVFGPIIFKLLSKHNAFY